MLSAYANGIYGSAIALVFSLVLTLGSAFDLVKNTSKVGSRKNNDFNNEP